MNLAIAFSISLGRELLAAGTWSVICSTIRSRSRFLVRQTDPYRDTSATQRSDFPKDNVEDGGSVFGRQTLTRLSGHGRPETDARSKHENQTAHFTVPGRGRESTPEAKEYKFPQSVVEGNKRAVGRYDRS